MRCAPWFSKSAAWEVSPEAIDSPTELTLAGHGKENQTAWFDDVTLDECSDQFYIRLIAALADVDDQTFRRLGAVVTKS
jgi:hypothetical protein